MSRKKRILFISLIVLVLVCFLLSIFVFCAVKETKINFSTVSSMSEQDVLSTLNQKNAIPYGMSTLFISRDDILNNVEEAIPKLKVKNVEVEFPNIIKINCEERVELFYIELGQNALVLDSEMKVISVLGLSKAKEQNLINLVIDEKLELGKDEWKLGKKINHKFLEECLKVYCILVNYYSVNSSLGIFCNHFDGINVRQKYDVENDEYILSLTFKTSTGKTIILHNPLVEMDKRLGKLIAITGDSSLTQDEIEITY